MFALWALFTEVKNQYLGEDEHNEKEHPLPQKTNEIKNFRTDLKIRPKPQPLYLLPKGLRYDDNDSTSKTKTSQLQTDKRRSKVNKRKQVSELKINLTSPDYNTFQQQTFDFDKLERQRRFRRAGSESVSSGIGLSSIAASETSSVSDYPFSDEEYEDFSSPPQYNSVVSSRRASFASCIEIDIEASKDRGVNHHCLISPNPHVREVSKSKVKSEIYTVVKPDVVHCSVPSITKTQIEELVLEKCNQ